MRGMRWVLVGAFGALVLGGSAPPVAARMSGTSCSASATWQSNGTTIDVATVTGTLTVPRSDSVAWQASVTGPPGDYRGEIRVDLPPPFGSVQIDSWRGTSSAMSNTGVEDYDLPGAVPAGVVFSVSGEHRDANGTCSGSIDVMIDGSRWSSPVLWGSLVGTGVTGIAAFALVRPLFRRIV